MVSKPHRGARKHLRTETATHDNHSPRAAWSRTSLRRSRVPVHASERINADFRSAAQNQLRFLKLEDDWKSVPMGEEGRVTHEDYWERITYFLEKTIPTAQEYDVRMACHPSDPPGFPFGHQGGDQWAPPAIFEAIKATNQLSTAPTTVFSWIWEMLRQG